MRSRSRAAICHRRRLLRLDQLLGAKLEHVEQVHVVSEVSVGTLIYQVLDRCLKLILSRDDFVLHASTEGCKPSYKIDAGYRVSAGRILEPGLRTVEGPVCLQAIDDRCCIGFV